MAWIIDETDGQATPLPCGGCAGLGSHRRWCPAVVGAHAARIGQIAEALEDLGDTLPHALANDCWRLSAEATAVVVEIVGPRWLVVESVVGALDAGCNVRVTRTRTRMDGALLDSVTRGTAYRSCE